jgi:transketolase
LDPALVLDEKDPGRKISLIHYLAQENRVDIFDMIHRRGNGHWGGSASAAEILTTLYFHILNIDPEDPAWEKRDRLVVSKGHAAPMLYTILAKRGFFTLDSLKDSFRCLDSNFQGHPCMNKTPGVEMSTGALGHGLSVALGMALAARVLRQDFWTFVLIGDGDLNEGETWEGIMAAAKFRPGRFVILIDYNKVQLDGPSDEILPMDPLPDKLRAFNINVCEDIFDGHDVSGILESWHWIRQQERWPAAVIYRTIKGKGVSFMENNHKWHGAPIDEESYGKGRPELIAELNRLRAVL